MAFTLGKKKEVIALDVGSNSIKLVQLKQAKKGWELVKLAIAYLPPEAIVDGSIIDSMSVTNSITDLLKQNNIKTKDIVTSLTGHSVIIKKVSFQAMTEEELAESIQWEAEQYIPFPMTDVNIDFQILGEDTEGRGQMDVMLVAVKKEVINDYINVIKEAGLNPVVMDVDSFALENMLEVNYTFAPGENIAMVNVGASVTSISVIVGGITSFTRSIPMGCNQYTEEIQRNFNISFKEAEDTKLGSVSESVEEAELAQVVDGVSAKLSMEVKRSIDFFLGAKPGIIVCKIFVCGGGARTSRLVDIMQESTALAVEVANPLNDIACNSQDFEPGFIEEMAPYFGVAVGLATRTLGDR